MASYLIGQQRLARLIWDECHLIYLSQSYRPIMKRVWHTLALPVPMVFASATLPVYIEAELTEMLALQPKPYIIRESLILKNMAYGVESLPSSLKPVNYAGYLIQWIKAFRAHRLSSTGRKTIIFCRTKAIVDQLYQALEPQAARFHSSLSEEERLAQLGYFRVERLILLATSGIGAGYDFPDVDLVIHFRPGQYEITSFIQESGRAGRSPDISAWSYCLIPLSSGRDISSNGPAEQIYFQQYLHEDICRRRVIARVFDSQAIEYCEPSWARCDLCASRFATLTSQSQAVKALERQYNNNMAFFARAVKYWTEERCFICWLGWYSKL